jgi:hypothetical protein
VRRSEPDELKASIGGDRCVKNVERKDVVMDERQSEISCVELTERGKGKEGKQR